MITKKEDLIGTIFNVADEDGGAIVRLAAMFYDVCTKYNIRVMGGNGRDYFMKAVGEGLVNLCIADEDGLGAFGRVSVSKDSVYGGASYSMSDFRYIDESELKSHLVNETPQTKEVEWDGEYQLEHGNGWFKYKTTYTASSGDMFAMCLVPNVNNGQPFEQYLDLATTKFRPLETQEQRKEREELEAAYDLYCEFRSERNLTVCSIENLHKESGFEFIMHFVRKTGYRKGE